MLATDPSIILGAQGVTLPDPQANMMNALAIRGANQTYQTNALAQQAAQRDFSNQAAIQSKFQSSDFNALSPADQQSSLLAAGGAQAVPIIKAQLDNAKTQADLASVTTATNQKMRSSAIQAAAAANSPEELIQNALDGVHQGAWSMQTIQPLIDHYNAGQIPTDPDAFAQYRAHLVVQAASPDSQFGATQPDVSTVDGQGGTTFVNKKPSAGPVGVVAGSPTIAPPPKFMPTDNGILKVQNDGTNSYLPATQPSVAAPAPPASAAPILPANGFTRLSPASPPSTLTQPQAPTSTSGAPLTGKPDFIGGLQNLQTMYQQNQQIIANPASEPWRIARAHQDNSDIATELQRNNVALPGAAAVPSQSAPQTASTVPPQSVPLPPSGGAAAQPPITAQTAPATVGAVLAKQSTQQPLSTTGGNPGAKDLVTPELAKNFGTYEEGLSKTVAAGQQLMPVIGNFATAMQGFQTGPGAPTRAALAQSLAALPGVGPDNSLVKQIAGGSLSDRAEIEKLSATMAMNAVRASMGDGNNRITQFDFKVFHDVNPGVATPPQTVYKVFQMMGQQFAQKEDEQQALNSYLQSGGNPLQFQAGWNGYLAKSGRIQVPGTNGSMVPMAGATPSAPNGAGVAAMINGDSDYASLPSGTDFIAPDGSHRRKP